VRLWHNPHTGSAGGLAHNGGAGAKGHGIEVVGYKKYRHAALLMKSPKDLQYLGLNGDIQNVGWFFTDKKLRVQGKRPVNGQAKKESVFKSR
jgi:hypothetical protein